MPTISVENYLKAIYHLEDGRPERVKTKELADQLGVALPSVTSMLKALAADGLVDYEAYRGAQLTEAGRRHAVRVIRNHRLIELFLVQALGYTWDEVHEEAELLEHAVSDRLADRIDQALKFPRTDPHGDPIPDASGCFRSEQGTPLTDCTPGLRVRLVQALEQDPEVLRYLTSLGVHPGVELRVVAFEPFGGPIRLAVGVEGAPVSLGLGLAANLRVAPT